MLPGVEVRQVGSQAIAVVRGLTTAANLPIRIRALFNEFLKGFKGEGGLNVVLYPTWSPSGEFEIECGVLVESGGNSSTPAGTIATAVHLGPYDTMKSTHDEIHRYVRENGHKLAGPSWEVYGPWTDEPDKLRTDIYYLLLP